MSINGKNQNIAYADLELIAKQNSIVKPHLIIEEIKDAISLFPKLAEKYSVDIDLSKTIQAAFRMDIGK